MAYELRQAFHDRPEYAFFDGPRPGRSVRPHQGCPRFRARPGAFPADPGRECWYCVFADFHLTSAEALQIGVCRYTTDKESESG